MYQIPKLLEHHNLDYRCSVNKAYEILQNIKYEHFWTQALHTEDIQLTEKLELMGINTVAHWMVLWPAILASLSRVQVPICCLLLTQLPAKASREATEGLSLGPPHLGTNTRMQLLFSPGYCDHFRRDTEAGKYPSSSTTMPVCLTNE